MPTDRLQPKQRSQSADGTAHLSDDGLYRYSLTRWVLDGVARDRATEAGRETCLFVMLNPSTADADRDDPTIRRCMRFTRDWGFARLKVVNLYALRATDPKALWLADDPVGPENDHNLALAFGMCDASIAAWGAHAKPERVAEVMAIPMAPRYALGLTKHGAPRHPLYMRADCGVVEFMQPPKNVGIAS